MKLHGSTQRLLQLLELLAAAGSSNIDELSSKSRIPYTTVYRILQTCVRLGYVNFTNDHKYQLSQKLFQISSSYLHENCSLASIAHPYLQKLKYFTKETVHLGILNQSSILYVDKIETDHKIRMYSFVGYQAEIHCTALGKAILSYIDEETKDRILSSISFKKYTPNTITNKSQFLKELDKVRTQRYAEDLEENEPQLYCIGVPVFDLHNCAVGAVSISIFLFRFNLEHKTKFINKLWECATQISEQLGNTGYQKCLELIR